MSQFTNGQTVTEKLIFSSHVSSLDEYIYAKKGDVVWTMRNCCVPCCPGTQRGPAIDDAARLVDSFVHSFLNNIFLFFL